MVDKQFSVRKKCRSKFDCLISEILFITELNPELRTVPTKYRGFCVRYGPRVKSRSLQGLLESIKENRGRIFSK